MRWAPAQVLILAVLALAVGGRLAAANPESSPAPMRRFALVAGSNGGGAGQVRLRYAASDARGFAAVLTELGGVSADDLVLLVDPNLAALRDSLRRMRDRVAQASREGARSEFILYYSGHSDDTGLELGAEKFGYEDLRNSIDRIGADVQVAIVDSCSSGSFTRAKGGTARPAFLFDASTDMKGHAYLTSSSADESAQESDRLGGSFFTHYLVSGLRGAADLDGRGVVTLNEAYAFAFKETLASTENTRYGAQHPAYEIHLTGSGDLVFTDLRATSAGLAIAEDVAGRMYIRDSAGLLSVELNKVEGKRMEVGLEPGTYAVVIERGSERYRASITVSAGRRSLLQAADLRSFTAEAAVPRGSAAASKDSGDRPGISWLPSIGIIPDLSAGLFSSNADRNVSINLLAGSSGSVSGFESAGLWNSDSRNVSGFQAAGLGNIVAGEVSAFQAAGLANYAGRDLRFAQAAGLANVSLGTVDGAQLAGLFNVGGRSLRGTQIAGLGNAALAESLAATDEEAGGSVQGAQIAGVVNLAFGATQGTQIAGCFNYARGSLLGSQISAVNVADSTDGAQIGVVNIGGRVRGLQLGVVNVADSISGLPIGIISVERGGILALEATWGGTDTPARLGFKVGTKHSYTLFSVGYYVDSSPALFTLGFGFGGRIPLGGAWLDLDLSSHLTLSEADSLTDASFRRQSEEARLLLGVATGGVHLLFGAALDYDIPSTTDAFLAMLSSGKGLVPRLVAGVQF